MEFGSHSLEALLWVAETVESGVYRPGSLRRTSSGIAFVLDNPPLRAGAFAAARLLVDGTAVAPEMVRCRAMGSVSWQRFAELSTATPLELRPGMPTEVEAAVIPSRPDERIAVRLELTSLAIPPLVWFEFSDLARPGVRL